MSTPEEAWCAFINESVNDKLLWAWITDSGVDPMGLRHAFLRAIDDIDKPAEIEWTDLVALMASAYHRAMTSVENKASEWAVAQAICVALYNTPDYKSVVAEIARELAIEPGMVARFTREDAHAAVEHLATIILNNLRMSAANTSTVDMNIKSDSPVTVRVGITNE